VCAASVCEHYAIRLYVPQLYQNSLLKQTLLCHTETDTAVSQKLNKIAVYLGFSEERFNVVWLNSEDIVTRIDSRIPRFNLQRTASNQVHDDDRQ